MLKKAIIVSVAAWLALATLACQTKHQVETVHKVEVAPMHITIDVNVRVDKALDDFFGDLDEAEKELEDKTPQ